MYIPRYSDEERWFAIPYYHVQYVESPPRAGGNGGVWDMVFSFVFIVWLVWVATLIT